MVKNMQKWVSNIPILLLLIISATAHASNEFSLLRQADSLYLNKKYAEAQELYLELYQQGSSTPATLLKMAFVHEGLGQTSQALFFLTAYYNQTEDPKAYDKILVLANARSLQGYELSDVNRLRIWIHNRVEWLTLASAAGAMLCLSLMFYFKRQSSANGRLAFGFLGLFFISVLFVSVNFTGYPSKAVIAKPTYVMNGPSAGAGFLGMVNDGNLVSLSGEKDVWMRITWNGKEGFVKKNDLLFYQ